jgi:hypothetical protein
VSEDKTETKEFDPIWQTAVWLREEIPISPLSNGDKAALRRLDPVNLDQRHLGPLFALLARLENQGQATDKGVKLSHKLADLITINALALANGRHDGMSPFGGALAAIDLGEMRLNMLVSADLDTLAELGPRIARRFAANGEVANWKQFHRLARTANQPTDTEAYRTARLQIARDYQRAARQH